MNEFTDPDSQEAVIAKLNQETSKIAWSKLMPFFAKGMAVYVSHKLDLIKVAYAFSQDNKTVFEKWTTQGQVANVTDEQASAWYESDVTVWCVVVKPFVLVQPIVD